MGCTCSTAPRHPWMRGRSRPGIALTTATRNGGFLSSANWTRFPGSCWYLCATTRSTFSRRSGSTTRPISMARAWSGRAIWIFVKRELDQIPGKLLVFVRYYPQHIFQEEWVYNAADIDGARVVWARDLGADEDQKLLRYYPDRTPLLLEPDFRPRSEEHTS